MIKILTESKEVCKSGIYKITCLANEKVYIGSAVDLNRRYSKHFTFLKNKKHCNLHLQNAFNKYGSENFTFEVIQYVPYLARLIFWEQLYLDYYHAANRVHGFNICPKAGSSLGVIQSVETRAKKSVAMTGKKRSAEFCAELGRISKGRKHTPESRAKMSLAGKGKVLSKSHVLKVTASRIKNRLFYYVATSPDGFIYAPIFNLSEFCRDHNLSPNGMIAVANGRQKYYKKWQCQKVKKDILC